MPLQYIRYALDTLKSWRLKLILQWQIFPTRTVKLVAGGSVMLRRIHLRALKLSTKESALI